MRSARARLTRACDLLAYVAAAEATRLGEQEYVSAGDDLRIAVLDLRAALWSALADIARP